MAKQNVFNFKTMKFELVECDDLLSLIDDLNAECAAQQRLHLTGGILPASEPLSPPATGTGIEYLQHSPTSK